MSKLCDVISVATVFFYYEVFRVGMSQLLRAVWGQRCRPSYVM